MTIENSTALSVGVSEDITPKGVDSRCVCRTVPFERYYELVGGILAEFQNSGFDVLEMDRTRVLTVGKETLLQFLKEAISFPHVFGLSRALSEAEVRALVDFVVGLEEQEVYLQEDAIEVDPEETVRAFIGSDGSFGVEEFTFPVRIGDILSPTVKIE